jgi:hypothetical protein
MPRPFQTVCLIVFFSAAVFSSILACSQTRTQIQDKDPAVVAFTLDFPASQPQHYSIRVPSEGPAHYQSSGRLSADSDESDSHDNDSFDFDFTVAVETRQRIFALAAKAGYFQKDADSHRKNLAYTGKKTLVYKDARRSGESTYNYSSDPAVEELTVLMQGLAATLEFGHRLEYDRRYQKLALDEELKRMEGMALANQLADITAIQPILDGIAADPSVINVTRARAQRLLERAGAH